MSSLINRIQRAILGGAGEDKVRALLTELAIPAGGAGQADIQEVRNGFLRPISQEEILRDALANFGLTGAGTAARPLARIRTAILHKRDDNETMLRDGLNDLMASGDFAGAAPTDIAWAGTHTIAENIALGTQVGGVLSVTDPDAGDTVTYSLTNDSGGLFGINGALVIVTGVIDYETATSHNITIRATDSTGRTYDEVFAITVTDIAETPPDLPVNAGEIIVDVPETFEIPPTVVAVDGAIAFQGKKKTGASGKFVFDIGPAVAGYIYTIRYDPDWSLLENGGVTAMVGFGLRHGNDFRLSGLKGNGSSGLKAYEVSGNNKWNQTSGFTTSDGGAAAHGTQGGPNWLQFEVAANGSKYTLRTSSDGNSWADQFTDITPSPFANVTGGASFGIAVFLEAADAGPFRIDISLWQSHPAVTYATFDVATVTAVTLSGGNLVATSTGTTSANQGARVVSSSGKTTGKYYFEMVFTTAVINQGDNVTFGIGTTSATYTNLGNSATGGASVYRNNGNILTNGSFGGISLGTINAGQVVGCAVDLDNRKIWFRELSAGSWNGSGTANPATNTGGVAILAGTMVPVCTFGGFGGTSGHVTTAKFGASSFTGVLPSGFTSGWTV